MSETPKHPEPESLASAEANPGIDSETQSKEQRETLHELRIKIRDAKSFILRKAQTIAEKISGDIKLNEELYSKLEPQIEPNRKAVVESDHEVLLNVLNKIEDTEKFYFEEYDELERLSRIDIKDYANMTAEQYAEMPKREQHVLYEMGGVRKAITETNDPDKLLAWASFDNARYVTDQYKKIIRDKLIKQAQKHVGVRDSKSDWYMLSYEPYEKFQLQTGFTDDMNKALSYRELNHTMTEPKAAEFFESSFRKGEYIGSLMMINNYLKYVPEDKRNAELLAKAKSKYIAITAGSEETAKAYETIIEQLEKQDSVTAKVLNSLYERDMGVDPFGNGAPVYEKKERVLQARLLAILQSPERGHDYLNYFVNKCGIRNLDRFSLGFLDKVYADKDNTEKPYGLLILARADHNGAFGHDVQMYDEFYKDMEKYGQRLLIAEASSDKELLQQIQAAYTRSGQKKMGFMVIGGHGTPDNIQLGSYENVHKKTPKRSGDFQKDEDSHIRMSIRASRKYIEPKAEVLAMSCSTGMVNQESTYPIAKAVAMRTGLITKGLSKPLASTGLHAILNSEGKIELSLKVMEGMGERRRKSQAEIRTVADVNRFESKIYRPEEYDHFTRSAKPNPFKKKG